MITVVINAGKATLKYFDFVLPVLLMSMLQLASAQNLSCYDQKSIKDDPCKDQQWHLNSGSAVHINVESVHQDNIKGQGMILGVVDSGILVSHPDLIDNVLSSNTPQRWRGIRHWTHGTQVAGIIAAVANNGIGGISVAPEAEIFGSSAFPILFTSIFNSLTHFHTRTAVYNNSWGPQSAFVGGGALFRHAINTGLKKGFNNKGSVYVFAAGNDQCIKTGIFNKNYVCGYRNSNYNGYANYYGVVTVGAVHQDGVRYYYSEMGANLWISAPSGVFTTTYKGLDKPYKPGYTHSSGGTSSAAPQISGVVALIRQANPNLTWRDVKLILAASAKEIDKNNKGCKPLWEFGTSKISNTCGNGEWLEGGVKYNNLDSEKYHFNHQYGFGLVDAAAAIELADENNWENVPAESSPISQDANFSTFNSKNLGSATKISSEIEIDIKDIDFIEFVDVTLKGTHPSFSDISVKLISPSGFVSELAVPVNDTIPAVHLAFINKYWQKKKIPVFTPSWKFGSARHLGEPPNGTWKLEITDRETDENGKSRLDGMESWEIKIYGHKSKDISGLADNANLANLQLLSWSGNVHINETFLPNRTSYTANIASNIDRISVIPTPSDSKASVWVNNKRVPKGSQSDDILLNAGSTKIIEIVVIAQNGSRKNYTVTGTRATATQQASDNYLSGLSLSEGVSLNFNRSKTSYTVHVANSISSVRVTPIASDSSAIIRVGSRIVVSGSASNSIRLEVGSNVIPVNVGEVNTYTITLIRAASADSNLSDDATLIGLHLSGIDLNESFISGKSSYTANIGSNINSVSVTPTANHQGATITVDGSSVRSGRSKDISITSNQQTIRVVVTSEDSSTVKTYTIVVMRAQSSDADLISLSLGNAFLGHDLSYLGLDPAPATFSPSMAAYLITIFEGFTTLEMLVAARDPAASITINGESVKSNVKHNVDIENANIIIVRVTSGDKSTTKEYGFAVIKLNIATSSHSAPGLSDLRLVQPSGDRVRLERGRGYTGFDVSKSDYDAEVDEDVGYITVIPDLRRTEGVQITVNGKTVDSGSSTDVPLEKGKNTITVAVILLQGGNSNIYTVEVERAYSDDATLSSLRLIHIVDRETSKEISLDPPFYGGKRRYEARVGSDINDVEVYPVANDSSATIRINNRRLRYESDDVNLNEGENEIEIEVTSESRDRRRTYVVEIWRGSEDDATLHDLKLLGEIDRFGFRSHDTSYRVNVGSVVERLTIIPIANDLNAAITVNDISAHSGVNRVVNLNDGITTITVDVISADGEHSTSYEIEVNRASAADVSLDRYPYLTGDISLTKDLSNDAIYTGEAAYSTNQTRVEINTKDLSARITVNNESVASGEESSDITLQVGVNIINVHVMSSDNKDKQIYTIIVTRAEAPVDYDSDNDNLIEIRNLEQLDAMRYGLDDTNIHPLVFPGYDVNSSCHSRCIGYELMVDLDFNDDASYRNLDNKYKWTNGTGWQPIGTINVYRGCNGQSSQCFKAVFDGNNYSISNLFIDRGDEYSVGLFSAIADGAHIRNIGIIDAQIVADDYIGTLVGINDGGTVANSYATGNITGDGHIGGLVSYNYNDGTITGSYAVVNISGGSVIGGLVARNSARYAEDSGGIISDSYSWSSVFGRSTIGGLVGHDGAEQSKQNSIGSVSNSYAAGIVSGISNIGGLRGSQNYDNNHYSGSINNSYWDIEAARQTQSNGGVGLTTLQMISPTAPNITSSPARYTNWDGNKWHFGGDQEYPAIRYFDNCENVSSNNPNQNEGDLHQADCGDLLPGQRAYLATLNLSDGATLLYPFNRLSTYYIATVGAEDSSVGITLSTTNSMDTITIDSHVVVSGSMYTASLQPGKNILSIIVASRDGSVRNYIIEIYRTVNFDYDVDDDDLIEISNLEQLNAMRYDLDGDGISDDAHKYEVYQQAYPGNSGCAGTCMGYELATDLDFQDIASYQDTKNQLNWINGEGWQPIGTGYGKFFSAIFEGNDHTISNLFIDRENSDYVGLFGFVTSDARIRNIGMIDTQVKGDYYTGGLIGRNDGDVSGSYVSGSVTGRLRVGGLIGRNYGDVSGSYISGSVLGESVVGGLIGENDGDVSGSYVSGSVAGRSNVGGLIGGNTGTVSNSYVVGDVIGSLGNSNSVSSIGGLIGYSSGVVTNNYALGRVSGTDRGRSIGGLIGSNSNVVSNNYVMGDVTGRFDVGGLIGSNNDNGIVSNNYSSGNVLGNEDIGGLIGNNDGTVSDSYATGSVLGNNKIGGLIGDNYIGTVSNSYAIGNVTGGRYVGGLIGNNVCLGNCSMVMVTAGTISSSYWNIETTTQARSDGEDALTTEQMIVPESPNANNPIRYSGWAATNWDFGNARQYPAVRYAEYCETTGNDIYRNEGDLKLPDCGDLLPEQHTYLTDLVLSDGAKLFPTFNYFNRHYTVSVNTNVSSIQITPIAETVNIIAINGTEVISGNVYTISLPQGRNTITISVTGPDGNIKTYSINILQATQANYDTDSNNLIEISSLEQLDAIRYDTNGDGTSDIVSNFEYYLQVFPGFSGCSSTCTGYELVNHLDFQDAASYQDKNNQSDWVSGEGWQPISSFNAIFEGNNYTISNLFIDQKDISNIGLFKNVAEDTKIRNIGLINAQITGYYNVGGLIGENNGDVSDSYVSGSVSGRSDIGGLIGRNNGDVSDSYVSGSVSGRSDIGGLIGSNYGGVSNSYATSSVLGNNSVGGLIGYSRGGNRISISYAKGDVKGVYDVGGLIGTNRDTVITSYATGHVWGKERVGGLVGNGGGAVYTSYATGTVSGIEEVGGLVGISYGVISNSHAEGHVSGDKSIGGLIGYSRNEVSNSYAMGRVSGMGQNIGGLIGDSSADVSNSYAYGSVTGKDAVGGLVGDNSANISNSYALGDVTGRSRVGGLAGDNADSPSGYRVGQVNNSYAIGRVQGINHAGGLVGSNICVDVDDDDRDGDYNDECPYPRNPGGIITASYLDTDTTGQSASGNGAGFSTTLLVTPTAPNAANPSRYSGWDTNNWHFGNHQQYPAIRYVGNCEIIAGNNPNRNEDNSRQPDCGDLLSGQRHANLLNLSLSDNAILIPEFNKTILSYMTRVAENTSDIGITVTAEDGVQRIVINNTLVASEDAHTISLSPPKSIIDINVIAMDGTTKTYSITVWQTASIDYDSDGDKLIGINTLEQLYAIRYDLNGDGVSDNEGNRDVYLEAFRGFTGCVSTCLGYELNKDLDFQEDSSYQDISHKFDWITGMGWQPITRFNAILEGNGHQIANLFIDRKEDAIGLFSIVHHSAHIRNINLMDIQVSGDSRVGGLIGDNSGTVSNCYVEGSVEGNIDEDDEYVGGLIGYNQRDSIVSNCYAKVSVLGNEIVGGLIGHNYSEATIIGSYTAGSVSGNEIVGGLVGRNGGVVASSYAKTDVTGQIQIGGLVGRNIDESGHNQRRYIGRISNSYATGVVQGQEHVGGFIGTNRYDYQVSTTEGWETYFIEGEVINSYWNTETSGQLISDGGTGLTKLLMTIPTMPNEGNPNRYIGWDATHWHFGNTRQYPALRYTKDCENLGSNLNLNEGTSIPDCGDLLPGQRDISLISLSLSNNVRLMPVFDKEITDYSAQVLMDLRHIAIRAVASDDVETVTVNGNSVENKSLTTVSLRIDETVITVVVTGGNGTIAKSYVITIVQRGNNPPQINRRLTDQLAEVGRSFSYAIPQDTFFDTDGDSLIYYTTGLPQRFDWFSDDGITFDPSDNTFEGTPGYRDASPNPHQHIITIGVNDGYGGTTETSFMLLVNSEPTGRLHIQPDIANERLVGLSTLDDANTVIDTRYQWQRSVTKRGKSSYVNIKGAESLSYLLPKIKSVRAPGISYRLNGTMTDGIGEVFGFSSDYILPNWPPNVIVKRSTDTVIEGEMVTLEAVGSDANLNNINYEWRQVSGPNVLRGIPRKKQTVQFMMPVNIIRKRASSTTLIFEVSAWDKPGNSSSTQAMIKVIKADNGQITTLGQPSQNGNRLTAPPVDLASDIDGIGNVTGYQWQISTDNRVNWIDINQASNDAEYIVPLSTVDGTQFRVIVSYVDKQGYAAAIFSKVATYAASNNQPRIELPLDNTILTIADRVSTDVIVIVSDANTSDTLTVTLDVIEGNNNIESTPSSITILPNSELIRPVQTFIITPHKSGTAAIRIGVTDDSSVAVNQNAEPVTLRIKMLNTAIRLRVKVFMEALFR